ncbi:MAG: hypothetical protein Tsb0015_16660 [Simkaniaceae bacterium]
MKLEIIDDEVDAKIAEVHIDGLFWKRIYKPFYHKKMRQIVSCESEEELRKAVLSIEGQKAKAMLLRKLTLKRHFSYELKGLLRKYCIMEEIIEKNIHKLSKLGYINDEESFFQEVRSCLKRGKGPYYIACRLGEKTGLSKEEIMAKMQPFSDREQRDAIKKVLEKRFSRMDLQNCNIRRKAFQFLLRRGFSSDAIHERLQKLVFDKDVPGI